VTEAADDPNAGRPGISTPSAMSTPAGVSTGPGGMRVLLVDVSDRGGIARYTACLRSALRALGVTVSLAGPRSLADPGLALAEHRWGPDVTGLARFRVLGRRAAEVAPSALLLARAVVRARCDVVHVQTEVVPVVDHRVLAAIARRRPVVITAHDPEPLEGGERACERQSRRWRVADAVIIHGEGVRRLVETSAPGVPVHVVPVDLPLGGPAVPKDEARTRLGLDDAPTALLLGLLRPYKGLGLLADAWPAVTARVPRARLLIVGEPYRCEELDRLERLEGVDMRQGFIAEGEFDCWAAAPDVLVLPYLRGSHSGILHRGVAAGTPVVASPSLADEVRRTGAGVVVPLEADAWAAALVSALTGDPPPPPPPPTGHDTAAATLAVYRDVVDRRERRHAGRRENRYRRGPRHRGSDGYVGSVVTVGPAGVSRRGVRS
jgi:glycosyltransferase involved in cell wall biosynthesis